MDAQRLKQRYASKWRIAARRELFVFNIINLLLDGTGCYALFTGVGSGSSEYLDRSYDNPLNAYDFTIICRGKVVAFLDVTGYRSYSEAKGDPKPCVLMPKLWKAEKLGIPLEKLWFLHFVDSRISLRVIQAWEIAQHPKAEKRYLVKGEHPYLCLDQRYWHDPSRLRKWLTGVAASNA